MTDETTLTQEQQDQAAVAAAEEKIVEEAATLQADENALASAKAAISENEQNAQTAAAPVADTLDSVIAAGIKQYDGYAEHADIVSSLREFSRSSADKTTEARNALAATLQQSYKIEN